MVLHLGCFGIGGQVGQTGQIGHFGHAGTSDFNIYFDLSIFSPYKD